MSRVVISDTSCLIALDKIDQLVILKGVFHEVITTTEVQKEFDKPLPTWIKLRAVQDSKRKRELENILDAGESSAIALSLETKDCLLILDEKKGRKVAQELNIVVIGTLKILLLAKQKKVIFSVKEIIQQLEKTGFYFTKHLREEILKEAKEL